MKFQVGVVPVSYTHLRAHETDSYLVCRLLLEKKKRIAPHRRIRWQSVEQAFLTVWIELIRRKKPPRTVSSNYVDRAKYHDLQDDSD